MSRYLLPLSLLKEMGRRKKELRRECERLYKWRQSVVTMLGLDCGTRIDDGDDAVIDAIKASIRTTFKTELWSSPSDMKGRWGSVELEPNTEYEVVFLKKVR